MSGFAIDPLSLRREEPATFTGPAGRIQGLWRPPRAGHSPRGVAVVAHPHPAYRGTMLNKVVFHTARVLNHDLDLAVLRFNFRGAGASDGVHDQGRGEVLDLLSAWSEAGRRAPGMALVAAGFSFGAAMTLRAAARETDAPAAMALLGIPLHRIPVPSPFPRPIPLVVVHGENDEFTPPEAVGEYLESWPGPRAFRVEPGADHFLEGALVSALGFVTRTLDDWLPHDLPFTSPRST